MPRNPLIKKCPTCGHVWEGPTSVVGRKFHDAVVQTYKDELAASEFEDECAKALCRLAHELGLPNDGPDENVNGAVALVRRLKAELSRLQEIMGIDPAPNVPRETKGG